MKTFVVSLAVVALAVAQRNRGASNSYGAPQAPPSQPAYGNPQQAASSLSQSQSDHQGLDWLLKSVPGQPGTDYPIYAEVPDTSFGCDGQVEGGYYADPDTECQAFHVCTADGLGGLAKYSFLCPNGTIFNQEYFICDWWFNFDCSQATGLYSLNEEVAAEREAASQSQGSSSNINNQYAAAPQSSYGSGK